MNHAALGEKGEFKPITNRLSREVSHQEDTESFSAAVIKAVCQHTDSCGFYLAIPPRIVRGYRCLSVTRRVHMPCDKAFLRR